MASSADARAEILLLSSSILVPCLTHNGVKVWDTLAIAEYLAEAKPKAGLLPAEREARAHCRSICGERTMADAMHAPVATRFVTYDVKLGAVSKAYCDLIMAMPEMQEWIDAALHESEEIDALDMEF